MKTMTKWVLAVLFAAFATSAHAQSSANVTATATIVAPVTVTQTQNLNFGAVVQGDTETVLAANNTTQRGVVTITKTAGSAINLSVTYPSTIDNGSDTINLVSNGTDYGTYVGDVNTTPVSFDPSTSPLNNIATADANLTVYLGGQIVTTGGTPIGIYTGTITVSVAYTAL